MREISNNSGAGTPAISMVSGVVTGIHIDSNAGGIAVGDSGNIANNAIVGNGFGIVAVVSGIL